MTSFNELDGWNENINILFSYSTSWFRNKGDCNDDLADFIGFWQGYAKKYNEITIEYMEDHVDEYMEGLVEVHFTHEVAEKIADKEGMSVDQYCHDYGIYRHWYQAQEDGDVDSHGIVNHGVDLCYMDGDVFTWASADDKGIPMNWAISRKKAKRNHEIWNSLTEDQKNDFRLTEFQKDYPPIWPDPKECTGLPVDPRRGVPRKREGGEDYIVSDVPISVEICVAGIAG